MAGNTIMINNSKNLEWYVGDSKIEKVIKLLNKHGIKMEETVEESKKKLSFWTRFLNSLEKSFDHYPTDYHGF